MGEEDLQILLASMQPILHEGVYVYATIPHGSGIPPEALAMFREHEAITLVLPKSAAEALNFEFRFECAWISLTVHSSLEAVGLTAAFSAALTQASISCNVMAGLYHDHIFVPLEQAPKALAVLQNLSKNTEGRSCPLP
jgi:uncharacterized protein